MECEDIELAGYGIENEGWFDPWSLLTAFKHKAISLGVDYVKADVVGFEFKESGTIIGGMEEGEIHEQVDRVIVRTPTGELKNIKFAMVILAGGHESGKIAEMARIGRGTGILSVPLPVEPRQDIT
jgi:FAD-dependent oxidoreductase domain-containing protein 1